MPRASWRGHLRLSLVSCPIYLSPAAARTKPIRLHQVWQANPAGEEGELPTQTRKADGKVLLTIGVPGNPPPLHGDQETEAKPMQFPDASGVPVHMLPARDASAFCSSRASRAGSQRERHHREELTVC